MSAAVGTRGPGWWSAVVTGAALMAVGLVGYLGAGADPGELVGLGLWVVGSDVVVDLLVLPAAAVTALLVRRRVPAVAQPPLLAGLGVTGVVMVLAWLPLIGSADAVGNPTIQPLDYGRLVALTLALVWVASAMWGALRWWRR